MKPPSAFQLLIGNPIVSLTLMLGAIFVLWLWWTGGVDGWTATFAVIIASVAANAAEKFNAYSRWKREWDGMSGRQGFRLPRIPNLRVVFAIGSWGLLTGLALDGAKGDPDLELAINLFWAATAIAAMLIVYRLFRPKRPAQSASVTVTLPTCRNSPSVRDALASLPAHVRLSQSGR